jgi:GAF domain-containing protein
MEMDVAHHRSQNTPSAPSGLDISTRHLVDAIQELSLAKDLPTIQRIVRTAVRKMTNADGASFVLRDDGNCYYADEDAIAPLWKGKRFPMETCISGWVMLNKRPVAIDDIYQDPRIPADAYRPTFVRSLVMTPIRTIDPIGAIGCYWSVVRQPESWEIDLLQALADSTSVAMASLASSDEQVKSRTQDLEVAKNAIESL